MRCDGGYSQLVLQGGRLARDRRGVTATEYAVLAALLIGVAIGGFSNLGGSVSTRLLPLSAMLAGGGSSGSGAISGGSTSGGSGSGSTSPSPTEPRRHWWD